MPCIINAANEEAVAAFYRKPGFLEMSDVIEFAMGNASLLPVLLTRIMCNRIEK